MMPHRHDWGLRDHLISPHLPSPPLPFLRRHHHLRHRLNSADVTRTEPGSAGPSLTEPGRAFELNRAAVRLTVLYTASYNPRRLSTLACKVNVSV